VSDHALFEEGEWPDALGTVDDLVGNNKVARSDFLLQRADSGEGDDGAHANVSQRSDVGLVFDLMRGMFVVETVSREEGDRDRLAGGGGVVLKDADGRRWLAPRRVNVEGRSKLEARERRDASAANYGDVYWCCMQCKQCRGVYVWGSRVPSYVLGTPAILRYGMEMRREKRKEGYREVNTLERSLARCNIHCTVGRRDKQFLSRWGSSCRLLDPDGVTANSSKAAQHASETSCKSILYIHVFCLLMLPYLLFTVPMPMPTQLQPGFHQAFQHHLLPAALRESRFL
jgi:hypothetical protein